MIIGRTPFRISFAGGGSDIKEFYEKDYGAVVSASINKYMYIILHPYFHDKIRIKYSKVEDVDDVNNIHHPIVRECLKKIGIRAGIEIASLADVPARTGLGSSSAFTVCLLHVLYTYKGQAVSNKRLAEEACEIEIDILKEPIGKQDQYAVSFGGINYIRFDKDNSVNVEPVLFSQENRLKLENNLMLFYVGGERDARDILKKQKENMVDKSKSETLKKMVDLSEKMRISMDNNEVDRFADLLHKGWLLKKTMADEISNDKIDGYYSDALKAGAEGGKLLGAGSGGFLLLYCNPELQYRVRERLNLKELDFKFDNEGSKIIYKEDFG